MRGEIKICNFVFKLRADYVQVNCKMAIYVSLIIKYMFGNLLNVRMVYLAVMILLSGYMNVFVWTEYAEKVCGALPGDTEAVVPAGTTSPPYHVLDALTRRVPSIRA